MGKPTSTKRRTKMDDAEKQTTKKMITYAVIFMIIFSIGYFVGVWQGYKQTEKLVLDKKDCYNKGEYKCFKTVTKEDWQERSDSWASPITS